MLKNRDMFSVGLVDDHKLMRSGLSELISSFYNFSVVLEAGSGKELIELLKTSEPPDIMLVDIHMKDMDGFETASWITSNHPLTKILALSMYDKEEAVIKMLRAGARGYLLKDSDPSELVYALNEIVDKGYYHSEISNNALQNQIGKDWLSSSLKDRELEFLKLVSTELTYKEIADKMCLSFRTIDGYRESLFEKLKVKSRTGLVLFAIREKIILT